jgi:glutamyl-tRNA synthetase
MRLRFAPSPTGQLHVGNARTALFNWLLAHRHDGTFILRIEDTDTERSTRESEASILEDLRWLGLDWDEGAEIGGPHGPYRQSERLHLYASYANELIAGDQAYYCFCAPAKLESDRKDDLAQGRPPKYRGGCRTIPPEAARARIDGGERPVVRFKVPESTEITFADLVRGDVTFNTAVIGDFVIARSDGRPQYNFAVVVDDALMEITHVLRGEDHISNTPRQLLLYRALGFPPPRFAHLALVMGPDHTPLSKRHGATSVAEFRLRGYLPEALVNYLALIGWSPGSSGDTPGASDELLPIGELARRFAIEDVGLSAGVFDVEKLAWMNRHYMKSGAPGRIAAESIRFFIARGYLKRRTDEALDYVASLLPMAVGSVDRLEEIPDRLHFVFEFDPAAALGRPDVAHVIGERGAREVIAALPDAIEGPLLDREAFRAAAARVRERTGQKGKALFHPIRVALTGSDGGPELDLAVPAIERGAALPQHAAVARIAGCWERAQLFAKAIARGPEHTAPET